jgi:hypothetical protein
MSKSASEMRVETNDILKRYPEIAELLHSRSLTYPIDSKAVFIEQMAAGSETVMFRSQTYDVRFGAGLLPDFFFPLASEEDLVTKVAELLISRGLVSLG